MYKWTQLFPIHLTPKPCHVMNWHANQGVFLPCAQYKCKCRALISSQLKCPLKFNYVKTEVSEKAQSWNVLFQANTSCLFTICFFSVMDFYTQLSSCIISVLHNSYTSHLHLHEWGFILIAQSRSCSVQSSVEFFCLSTFCYSNHNRLIEGKVCTLRHYIKPLLFASGSKSINPIKHAYPPACHKRGDFIGGFLLGQVFSDASSVLQYEIPSEDGGFPLSVKQWVLSDMLEIGGLQPMCGSINCIKWHFVECWERISRPISNCNAIFKLVRFDHQ